MNFLIEYSFNPLHPIQHIPKDAKYQNDSSPRYDCQTSHRTGKKILYDYPSLLDQGYFPEGGVLLLSISKGIDFSDPSLRKLKVSPTL